MKLLIDECLSPELARKAQDEGHGQSSHVVWLGRGGWKDWQLKPFILDGDWTFVTRNAIDFRGSARDPGNTGEYAGVQLHAGLICLNGPPGMDLEMQIDLFDEALAELTRDPDLVNQVIEVTMEGDNIRIQRYRLPAEDD